MADLSNNVKEVCEFFKDVLISKDGGPVSYHNLRGFVTTAPDCVKQYVKKNCKGDNLLKFFQKHNECFLVEKFYISLKTEKPYQLPKDGANETNFDSSKPSSHKSFMNVKQTCDERIEYESRTKEFFIKLLTQHHELVVNAIDLDTLPKKVWYFLKKYMNKKVEIFFLSYPDLFLVDEGYVRLIKQQPVTVSTSQECVTKSFDECNKVENTLENACIASQTSKENYSVSTRQEPVTKSFEFEINLDTVFESLIDCYYTVHFICFKIVEKEYTLCLAHDYKAVQFFVDILVNSPSSLFFNNIKYLQSKLNQADKDTLLYMNQLYEGEKIKNFFMKHKEFLFDSTSLSVELSEAYNIHLQNTALAQKSFVKSESYLEKLCSYFWVQQCIDVFKALFQLVVFLKDKPKVKLSRLLDHVSELHAFLDILEQLNGDDHIKKLETFLNYFTFFIRFRDNDYAVCSEVKSAVFVNSLKNLSGEFSENVNELTSKMCSNCLPESFLSSYDLKLQIVTCVENGLNNDASLSYEELPKLFGAHIMKNIFHCGLWCCDILWILIDSAIFDVDNGLISKKKSYELSISNKMNFENSYEILLQPKSFTEKENLFDGCEDIEHIGDKDNSDSETNVANVSQTSSNILQEPFLVKEGAEACDSRELLKNESCCYGDAASADDRKDNLKECEYFNDVKEKPFSLADEEVKVDSRHLFLAAINKYIFNDEKRNLTKKETVLRDIKENIHEVDNSKLSHTLKIDSCQKDFQIAEDENSLNAALLKPLSDLMDTTKNDLTEKETILLKSAHKFQENTQDREPVNLMNLKSENYLNPVVSQTDDVNPSPETSEAAEFTSPTLCASDILCLEKLALETAKMSVISQKVANTSKAACSEASTASICRNIPAKSFVKKSKYKKEFSSDQKPYSFSKNKVYELNAFFSIFDDFDVVKDGKEIKGSSGKIGFFKETDSESNHINDNNFKGLSDSSKSFSGKPSINVKQNYDEWNQYVSITKKYFIDHLTQHHELVISLIDFDILPTNVRYFLKEYMNKEVDNFFISYPDLFLVDEGYVRLIKQQPVTGSTNKKPGSNSFDECNNVENTSENTCTLLFSVSQNITSKSDGGLVDSKIKETSVKNKSLEVKAVDSNYFMPIDQVCEFFKDVLLSKDGGPVSYHNLRGFIATAPYSVKQYVKKNCKGNNLLKFFQKHNEYFLVEKFNISLKPEKPYQLPKDGINKIVKSVDDNYVGGIFDNSKSSSRKPKINIKPISDEMIAYDSKTKEFFIKQLTQHHELAVNPIDLDALPKKVWYFLKKYMNKKVKTFFLSYPDLFLVDEGYVRLNKQHPVTETTNQETLTKTFDECNKVENITENACTASQSSKENHSVSTRQEPVTKSFEFTVNLDAIFESLVDCYYTVHFICFKIVEKEYTLCLAHDYKAVQFFVNILMNSPSCIFSDNMKYLQSKLGQADKDILQFMKQLYKGDKIMNFFMKHKEFLFDPTSLSVELSETCNIHLQNTASAQKSFVKSKSYLKKLCSDGVKLCVDVFKELFQLVIFLQHKQKVKLSRLWGYVSTMPSFLDLLKHLDGDDHIEKLEHFLNYFKFFNQVADNNYVLGSEVKSEVFVNALKELSGEFSIKKTNIILSKVHSNCLRESLLSCDDLKMQIVKCVENGFSNNESLSYTELPKLLGAHLMHNMFHCDLCCSDILWILIESAIFDVDNGLIINKKSNELNISDKNSFKNSNEILLHPNLVTEEKNIFDECEDTGHIGNRNISDSEANVSQTSSIILKEESFLVKEGAEACDTKELLKNKSCCYGDAALADNKKDNPSKCEYFNDVKEKLFFPSDEETKNDSRHLILENLLHNDQKSNSDDVRYLNAHHSTLSSGHNACDESKKDFEAETLIEQNQSSSNLAIQEVCDNSKNFSSINENILPEKLVSRNLLGFVKNFVQTNSGFGVCDKEIAAINVDISDEHERNLSKKESVLRDVKENIHERDDSELSHGLKIDSCQKDFEIEEDESILSTTRLKLLSDLRDTKSDALAETETFLLKSKFQETIQVREPPKLSSIEPNKSLDSGVSLTQTNNAELSAKISEAAELTSSTLCSSEVLNIETLSEISKISVNAQKISNTSNKAFSKTSTSSISRKIPAKTFVKKTKCKKEFSSNHNRNSFSENKIYEMDAFFNIFNDLEEVKGTKEIESVSKGCVREIDYFEKPDTESNYETSKYYSLDSSSKNISVEDNIYKYALSIENGTVCDISDLVCKYEVEDNFDSFKKTKLSVLNSDKQENYSIVESRNFNSSKEDSCINQINLKNDSLFLQLFSAKIVLISSESCIAESSVDSKKTLVFCLKSSFHCDEHYDSDQCFNSLTVGDFVLCYIRAISPGIGSDTVFVSDTFSKDGTCSGNGYSEKLLSVCDQFLMTAQKKGSDPTNFDSHSLNNSFYSPHEDKSDKLYPSKHTNFGKVISVNSACDCIEKVSPAKSSHQRILFPDNDKYNLEKNVDIQPCTVSTQSEGASYVEERQVPDQPFVCTLATQTHLELSESENQTVISYAFRSDKGSQADVISVQQGTQTMAYLSDCSTQTVIAGSIKSCKESSIASMQTTLTVDVKDCPPQFSTFCQTATVPLISQLSQTENSALSICMQFSINFKDKEVVNQSVQCGSLVAGESRCSIDEISRVLCDSGSQTLSTGVIMVMDYIP